MAPQTPPTPEPTFQASSQIDAAGLAAAHWPGSVDRFVRETQRYQRLLDRLQAEVAKVRPHDHNDASGGADLTDAPHEFTGLLDRCRAPKPLAVAELAKANQPVLPMLRLESLVVAAGEYLTAGVYVAANLDDLDDLDDVDVEVRFGDAWSPDMADQATDSRRALHVDHVDHLAPPAAHHLGTVVTAAPSIAGSHDLVVRLQASGGVVATNRYPVHVVAPPMAPYPVHVLGDTQSTVDALDSVHAQRAESGAGACAGATVVSEGGLDEATGREVRRRLAAGQVAIILAQPESAAAHYPLRVDLNAVGTGRGSPVFQFTTDHGALPSLPRRHVLVTEDSTIQPQSVVTRVDGGAFPDTPVVIAYNPAPDAMTGTVVGSHTVGSGRLVFCQYRLCSGAAKGDAAARAVLADLIRWASEPRPTLVAQESRLSDGRRVARYSHTPTVAR